MTKYVSKYQFSGLKIVKQLVSLAHEMQEK